MPHELPAATVTVLPCTGHTVDYKPVPIPKGAHLQVLHRCADQDGWNGEIACLYKDKWVAIAPPYLRLTESP